MAGEQERRRRAAASRRRYREENREQIADYKRRYRNEHADEIAAYRKQWREDNLEHARRSNRDYMRRQAAQKRAANERRTQKAAYARDRYNADLEAGRARARTYRVARRAADPEGYRAGKKRRNDTWRRKHRDEINQRLREKNRTDPGLKAKRAQRYYEAHAEERRDYSRRYHEQHREQDRERSREWRRRERRRREAGLPVRRVHRVAAAERKANSVAAEAFFARPLTAEYREQLEAELRTPPELIAAWQRLCERTRAAQYALLHPETGSGVVNRRQAEEERMDAIARVINERLRVTPRRPEPCPQPDPYEPVAPTPSGGIGL